MAIDVGETVMFKFLPEVSLHQAVVASCDAETITLTPSGDAPRGVKGQHLVVWAGDQQVYAEVLEEGGGILKVHRRWSNERNHFRVDDNLPLDVKRITEKGEPRRSRIYPVLHTPPPDLSPPDTSVHPQLWKMLVGISGMLGQILERMGDAGGGLGHAERRPVNVSASGIRFRGNEKLSVGDEVEIRMVLPLNPPLGVLTYGIVIRAADAGNGETEIAVRYTDMDEQLRDDIVRYTLLRQRDFLRGRRE